jgi:CRP-like cAMP-binding protein
MAPWTLDERRKLLAGVPLFGDRSAREINGLVHVARSRGLRPREELFHKGDEGSAVYVVTRGRLKALTTSEEGDDVVFSILGPGEVVGEIAFLGSARRTATVVALAESELLSLDRRDFLAFLKRHPEAAIKLLSVVADRLKHVSELVEDTLFLNLPIRLAKKLVNYASMYGSDGDGGLRIDLKLSQEEWGDLVGATRESINKQMRSWADEGLLRVEHGYVVLLEPDEFEKLAGCSIT